MKKLILKTKELSILILISMTTLTASADSQTLSEAIGSMNSAVNLATTHKSQLTTRLSNVSSEITRVRTEIAKAKRNKSSVISDTSSIKNTTSNNNTRAKTFRSEASEYRKERDKQNQRKSQLTEQLLVLLEESYKLQEEIDAETIKFDSLTELYEKLSSIKNNISRSLDFVDSAITKNEDSLTQHKKWLNSFNDIIVEHKPNFRNINSSETFKLEHYKILLYKRDIPSQLKVINEEKSLLVEVDTALDAIKTLFNSTRSLSNLKGLGFLSSINKNLILDSIVDIDSSLSDLYSEVTGLKSSVYKREYKRLYLIDFTQIAWTRLAEESLLSSNAKDASSIINSFSLSLNDGIAYAEIRSAVTNKEREYSELYRTYYSLRHARRSSLATLQFAKNLLANTPKMQISSTTRSEIIALLKDHINKINNDIRNINSDLTDEEYYHQRRIMFTNRMVTRYSDSFSNSCNEIASKIVIEDNSSIFNEKEFIKFKGSCL